MIFLFPFEIFPRNFFLKKQFSNIILLSTNLLDWCHDVRCVCAYVCVCIVLMCVFIYLSLFLILMYGLIVKSDKL